MNRKEMIIALKQYKDALNYLKRFEEKEEQEVKTDEYQKVKVLKKVYKGRTFKVA
jgi:hypothetical protein